MSTRTFLAATALSLVGVGAAIAPAPAVSAKGGWAVTTVDAFAPPAADEPVDITFTIRQHGVTPVDVEGVAIVVEDTAGASDRFAAASTGTVGRYVATVAFPDEGRLEWSVVQGWFGPQDLGAIDIGAAATNQVGAAATAPSASSVPRWPLALRLMLPIAAVGLVAIAAAQLPRPGRRGVEAS